MNQEKAKNCILYVSDRMKNCPGFGAVLLNKILYFSDHIFYLRYGTVISGFSYIKQSRGPTPNPSEFLQIREDLIKNNELTIESNIFFGKLQKKPVVLKPPDLNSFTPEEISVIDEVIYTFKDGNAAISTAISHEELAWQIASSMEELPYYSFFLTQADLTDYDITWAKEAYQKHVSVPNN